MEQNYLIADIGGTNSRFAIAKVKNNKIKISKNKILITNDFQTLLDASKEYLNKIKFKGILTKAVFCIAGKIDDNPKLTNSNLKINLNELKKELNLQVHLLNDFIASAYSVEKLSSLNLKTINKGKKNKNKTKVIIGAGTGLGKARILYDENTKQRIISPSEGGHNDFPFVNNFEFNLVEFIKTKYNKKVVEQEDLVSGRGIEDIYEYLTNKQLNAKEISDVRRRDKDAKKTFQLFYKFYARIAKDFALDELSEGGVYIAGGIIQKNLNFSKKEFVKEFTNNQTFSIMLKNMPIYAIKDRNINLIGIGNYIIKNKL